MIVQEFHLVCAYTLCIEKIRNSIIILKHSAILPKIHNAPHFISPGV